MARSKIRLGDITDGSVTASKLSSTAITDKLGYNPVSPDDLALYQQGQDAYIQFVVGGIIDSAPEALDTLNELAAALGDDANFASTVATSLSEKASKSTTITIGSQTYDLSQNRTFEVFSGSYNDLTNLPTLFSGSYIDLTDKPVIVNTALQWTANHTLADGTRYLAGDVVYDNGNIFVANYDNESLPTTNTTYWSNLGPGLRLNIDGRDILNISYNQLTNKPTLFSGSYIDLTDKPTLFSGSYIDLTDKPTIPTVPTNISSFTNDSGYLTSYSETDTLQSVTTRGATTDKNITVADLRTTGNLQVDGNLTVNGTQNIINTVNLAVEDNMIYLNSGSTVTNPDLGFAGNYNDGTYRHAGLFRDATDGRWKFYHQYTLEPDASAYIDITHPSFALANVQANTFIGSLTGNADTVTNGVYSNASYSDPTWITSLAYSKLTGTPTLFSGAYADLTGKPTLATVATSGSYTDLTNKPTIPNLLSITSNLIPSGQPYIVDIGSETNPFNSGYIDRLYLQGNIAIDGTTGLTGDVLTVNIYGIQQWAKLSYNNLTDKPTLFSGSYTDLTNKPTFATVATSGSYTDLTNKPTIPNLLAVGSNIVPTGNATWSLGTSTNMWSSLHTAVLNVNAHIVLNGSRGSLNQVLTSKGNGPTSYPVWSFVSYNDLTDKPTLATVATSGSYTDLINRPTLATVATTGSYTDLTNKPTLFSGSYIDLTNKPTLFSGSYTDLTNKPTLATVATTGSYNDLLNKPTIPTPISTPATTIVNNVAVFSNTSGSAIAGSVLYANSTSVGVNSDPSIALNGLGLDVNATVGTKQIQALGALASGTNNIDCTVSNTFSLTLSDSSAHTISLQNLPTSRQFIAVLYITVTNGFAPIITWSNIKWAGGNAPTLPSGKTHMIVIDSGPAGQFAAYNLNYNI